MFDPSESRGDVGKTKGACESEASPSCFCVRRRTPACANKAQSFGATPGMSAISKFFEDRAGNRGNLRGLSVQVAPLVTYVFVAVVGRAWGLVGFGSWYLTSLRRKISARETNPWFRCRLGHLYLFNYFIFVAMVRFLFKCNNSNQTTHKPLRTKTANKNVRFSTFGPGKSNRGSYPLKILSFSTASPEYPKWVIL